MMCLLEMVKVLSGEFCEHFTYKIIYMRGM